ncbi:hypothetical protein ACFW04_007395 [Cataglyphis niger]
MLEAWPIDRPPPTPRPPKVGTFIQRSDRINRIKAAMLATPPPPLASCPRRRNYPSLPARQSNRARKTEDRHRGTPHPLPPCPKFWAPRCHRRSWWNWSRA